MNNALEAIGNTPLIKINKLTKKYGVKATVYAKCEFFNSTSTRPLRLPRALTRRR